tara:strand:+ start:501 stop:944 length:444 start_codon:yes stop_codon:yes gene_type:complete
MNNWKNILLKSNQITVGSSALDTRELPEEEVEEEEDKCCMEAAKVWVDTYNEIDAKHFGGPKNWQWPEKYTVEMLMNDFLKDMPDRVRVRDATNTMYDNPSQYWYSPTEDFCKEFRKVLEKEGRKDSSFPIIAKFQRALWAWEDCER